MYEIDTNLSAKFNPKKGRWVDFQPNYFQFKWNLGSHIYKQTRILECRSSIHNWTQLSYHPYKVTTCNVMYVAPHDSSKQGHYIKTCSSKSRNFSVCSISFFPLSA